jgi:hypothetical protein
VPPQDSVGREPTPIFAPNEFLFRQVPNTHIEDNGEVSFFAIQTNTKFSDIPSRCTSVVRSAFTASFLDAIHPNCAGGKDLSATHSVRHVRVADLPRGLRIVPEQQGDNVRWNMYPHHVPLPLCYAHSTICCCNQDAPGMCAEPPPSVRAEFRRWFAANLRPSEGVPLEAATVEAVPLAIADDPLPATAVTPGKERPLPLRVMHFCKAFLQKLIG